jgi:monovalent cation:H+ antiporter-2, CPA2 family
MKVLNVAQEAYPDLPVIVRTYDDAHIDEFRAAGATEVVPEVLEGSLMLASHALVLLGVPLNRVVKRIRLFREARYKMFKGFFRGISDVESDMSDAQQVRLHSVEINPNSFAAGKRLDEIDLPDFNVQLQVMRRLNMLEDIAPRPDIVLADGDVLVLLGHPQDLISAEIFLISGK